jgi:hypothetical protein
MFLVGAAFFAWAFKTREYEPALTSASADGKPPA